MAPRPPLGQRVHLTLVQNGRDPALAVARDAGQPDLFDRVDAVASKPPITNFLHSALCAMSLPVGRRPNEHAPIVRRDGQYTLVINPKPASTCAAAGRRRAASACPTAPCHGIMIHTIRLSG